jgi:hypothetical protein
VSLAFAPESQVALHGIFHAFFWQCTDWVTIIFISTRTLKFGMHGMPILYGTVGPNAKYAVMVVE